VNYPFKEPSGTNSLGAVHIKPSQLDQCWGLKMYLFFLIEEVLSVSTTVHSDIVLWGTDWYFTLFRFFLKCHLPIHIWTGCCQTNGVWQQWCAIYDSELRLGWDFRAVSKGAIMLAHLSF